MADLEHFNNVVAGRCYIMVHCENAGDDKNPSSLYPMMKLSSEAGRGGLRVFPQVMADNDRGCLSANSAGR
jgi:hypothetical protein